MKCSVCKQEIKVVIRRGKGGIDTRIESCCGITRVREIKRTDTELMKGYYECKVWK